MLVQLIFDDPLSQPKTRYMYILTLYSLQSLIDTSTFPFFFMTATLIHERDGQEYVFTQDKTSRILTGTLTSSLYRLRDLENTHGCFFVFPELSCQKEGVFRLKFVLFEISG
jgi:hypothetical protein